MKKYADIVLFVFNRPEHTLRTLQALKANPEAAFSKLWIFCDGPRSGVHDEPRIEAVRDVVRQQKWCREIVYVEQSANLGLAESIRSGVSTVFRETDRVVVLEDDILTAPGFLGYMNQALHLYADEPRVMNVCGYLPTTSRWFPLPETFFQRMMSCWGWATWRRSWQCAEWDAGLLMKNLQEHPGGLHRFDLDGTYPYSEHLKANLEGRMKTWAVFWAASCYLRGGLSLYPNRSLVQNIGFDGSGTNCGMSNDFTTLASRVHVRRVPLSESALGRCYLKSCNIYGQHSGLAARLTRLFTIAKTKCIRLKHVLLRRHS
jgi:hypothetical protein